ncbi:MAG TPA: UbiA family prenyltransferase [Opitutaceae bacterium]|nr:UbiA family prenyltransferase [Opitutaceae bacterium]
MTSIASGRAELGYLLKVSRPGFWLTQLWFYLLPLARVPVLDSGRFWLGAIYFSIGLGFALYGWNDLVDTETDRFNPRKDSLLFGARGTPDQLGRLPWVIAFVQLPFVVIFTLIEGPRMAVWFAALFAATVLYNHFPPSGLKGRPPFELFNQLGYLLVFVGSSWLNQVPQLPWPTFVFGGLFAMHSHLFGEIMDIGPDRAAGRRTTASVLGVTRTKVLLVAFLAAESGVVFAFFKNPLVGGALGLAAVWFLLDALVLWRDRPYTAAQMRFFFLGWNAVALASMAWIWQTGALSFVR